MEDKKICVLIAEDSPTQAAQLGYILEKNNFTVYSAINGEEALEILKTKIPDIIISDIIMPKMDGFELTKNVKSDSKYQKIPIILLTALKNATDILRGFEAGANFYIIKPLNEKEIVSKIKEITECRTEIVDKCLPEEIEFSFQEQKYHLAVHPRDLFKFLIETYEMAIRKNDELEKAKTELTYFNTKLEDIVAERTALLLEEIEVRKSAEIKLAASEVLYRRLFEAAHDGILILDGYNGKIIDVNPYLIEMLGYSYEEFLGKKLWEIGTFKNIAKSKDAFLELQKNEYIRFEDMPLETVEGRHIDVEFVSNVYKVDGKDVIQCNIRNITERKLEERYRDLTTRILETLNRANNLNIIVNDLLNLVKSFNNFDAVAIRLREGEDYPYYLSNGFSEDFLITENSLCSRDIAGEIIRDSEGKPYLECMCGNVLCKRFDPALDFFTEYGSFWTNSTTKHLSEAIEKELRTLTRYRCNSEGYESVALIPLKSEDGIIGLLQINDKRKNRFSQEIIKYFEGLSSAIGIALNRRKSKEELEESERKLRSYIENAPEGIFIVNKDGKYQMVNQTACDMTGYSVEELLSGDISLLMAPESMEFGFSMHQQLLKEGKMSAEVLCKRKDGTKYFMLIDAVKISENQYIAFCRDMTDKKLAELELIAAKETAEESSRLKSSFLANMSHELRTPMVGILGFSSLLDNAEDVESVRDIGKYINISGKRLMETLNLILDLSRIEAGEMALDFVKVDLIEEMKIAVEQFKAFAAQKNLALSFYNDFESLLMESDKKALTTILNNLINNAIKYTNEGKVEVSINKEKDAAGESVVIQVADTGIGIPEDHLETIFVEFRQVSEGLSRAYEGTGLGLTLCKKFVNQLGGSISVKSKFGEGSTFTVKLPIKKGKSEQEAEKTIEPEILQKEVETILTKGELSNVLLVEDDEISYKLIKAYSKNLCNMDIAKNAKEALEQIKQKKYNAILMDINLGRGMNGVELTKILRDMPDYKDIPIVAVTAYAMVGDREEFIEAGCTHYISKPFEQSSFVEILADALGS